MHGTCTPVLSAGSLGLKALHAPSTLEIACCRFAAYLVAALETMVLKHAAEAKILQSSKMYDAALKEQNLDQLDSLVDPNYTIHADGITLKVHNTQNAWLH